MMDIKSYKDKLERGLAEYMEIPVNQRSADAVKGMMEAWLVADKLSKCTCHEDTFTREDAETWNAKMLNDDGTTGGQEAGGFTPAAKATQINWIICPKSAPIAVSKTDNFKIIDPDANQSADAWLIAYRKFHDLWIKDNMLPSIRVCAVAKT